MRHIEFAQPLPSGQTGVLVMNEDPDPWWLIEAESMAFSAIAPHDVSALEAEGYLEYAVHQAMRLAWPSRVGR